MPKLFPGLRFLTPHDFRHDPEILRNLDTALEAPIEHRSRKFVAIYAREVCQALYPGCPADIAVHVADLLCVDDDTMMKLIMELEVMFGIDFSRVDFDVSLIDSIDDIVRLVDSN